MRYFTIEAEVIALMNVLVLYSISFSNGQITNVGSLESCIGYQEASTIASSLSSQNITPEQWKENRLNSNCSDEEIKLVVSRLEESDKVILVS